jgi:hypothetical protein
MPATGQAEFKIKRFRQGCTAWYDCNHPPDHICWLALKLGAINNRPAAPVTEWLTNSLSACNCYCICQDICSLAILLPAAVLLLDAGTKQWLQQQGQQ